MGRGPGQRLISMMSLSTNNIFLVTVFLTLRFSFCDDQDQCLIGNDVFKTRLFCPAYIEGEKLFCCGDLGKRFCCSREEYEAELASRKKSVGSREQFESLVIKKRFRYEDGSRQAKVAFRDMKEKIKLGSDEKDEL